MSGYKQTKIVHVRTNMAKKLQKIPYLNAGISCWGLGTIGETPTDRWLANFIDSNTFLTTLQKFANELAKQLNEQVTPNNSGSGGFHLAGFENYKGNPTPSFYHIHDGRSDALEKRGVKVDSNKFNANHDIPPHIYQKEFERDRFSVTRNGDYIIYAKMFYHLERFFKELEKEGGIKIPNSQNLKDRAEYLVFQIRTMSEIYRLSNLVPGIGGSIYYLTINPHGIYDEGVRHF